MGHVCHLANWRGRVGSTMPKAKAKSAPANNKGKSRKTPSGRAPTISKTELLDANAALAQRAKNANAAKKRDNIGQRVAVGLGGLAGIAGSKQVAKLHKYAEEEDKRIHIPRTNVGYVTAAGVLLGGVSLLASKSPLATGTATSMFVLAGADVAITDYRDEDFSVAE